VAVAVLDMAIYLAHALNVLVDIIQKAELILVNPAALENGQTQEIAVVKIVLVLTLLDAKHAQRQPLVALVRLDMKVITLEDAEYAMKEHILQPVDLVVLVLLVNGPFLEAIFVKVIFTDLNFH